MAGGGDGEIGALVPPAGAAAGRVAREEADGAVAVDQREHESAIEHGEGDAAEVVAVKIRRERVAQRPVAARQLVEADLLARRRGGGGGGGTRRGRRRAQRRRCGRGGARGRRGSGGRRRCRGRVRRRADADRPDIVAIAGEREDLGMPGQRVAGPRAGFGDDFPVAAFEHDEQLGAAMRQRDRGRFELADRPPLRIARAADAEIRFRAADLALDEGDDVGATRSADRCRRRAGRERWFAARARWSAASRRARCAAQALASV